MHLSGPLLRIRGKRFVLWIAMVLVQLSWLGWAQTPAITLDSAATEVSIAPGAGIAGDPGGRMTVDDAVDASYQPIHADQKVSPASKVYWVRLPLHRTGIATARWLLRVDLGWKK